LQVYQVLIVFPETLLRFAVRTWEVGGFLLLLVLQTGALEISNYVRDGALNKVDFVLDAATVVDAGCAFSLAVSAVCFLCCGGSGGRVFGF
jgi:hypothetical protein